MTRKCTISLIAFCASLLLVLAAAQFMSLFPGVSKWLGVGVGGGVLVVMLVIYIALGKRCAFLPYIVIALSSLATGIAVSSLFVYYGAFPEAWHSVLLYACLVAAFALYLLLTNIPFFRRHSVTPLVIYSVLLIAAAVLSIVFIGGAACILAAMCLIPLIAFLISLPAKAKDKTAHIKNLAYCSLGFLFVAVVVVLVILSEGEGLDGVSGGDGYGKKRKNAVLTDFNPYDYN